MSLSCNLIMFVGKTKRLGQHAICEYCINFVETKNVISFTNNHFKNVGYASEQRKSYMEKKDKRRFELSKYYFNFSI